MIAKKKLRFSALIFSAALGVVVSVVAYTKTGALSVPLALFLAVFFCIPAAWQFFIMPVCMRAKDYCLSVALYLTFWGGPFMLYFMTFNKTEFPAAAGCAYLGALLLSWGLGAFLPKA